MTTPATCPVCRTALPADSPEGICPECLLRAGVGATPGAPRAPSMTVEEAQQRFPQFEVLSLLGQGGMGVVWKARQRSLDRLVALKVLPADVAAAPGFSERFQREARALARLDHPNIVHVYESGMSGGLFYLAMEFVDGTNLRQAMEAKAVRPREALAIVPQICDALQYAHDQGVVHRDVKPENVLLDRAGHVKVADFGLAKLMAGPLDRGLTITGQVMGTPAYMAPEQYEHPTEVDHRADIYSLGVVFYEMLTGELPLGRFAAPSKRVQLDVRLDEIVLRTLEKERDARYQRVAEVRTQVDAVVAGPAPPLPAPEPDRPWRDAAYATGRAMGHTAVVAKRSGWPRVRTAWAGLMRLVARPGVSALCVTLGLWTVGGLADEVFGNSFVGRAHAEFLGATIGLSAGILVSFAMLVRVRRSRGPRSDWLLASTAVIIAATAIAISVRTFPAREFSARQLDAYWQKWNADHTERNHAADAFATKAESLLHRLQAVHGAADFATIRAFYAPADRELLDDIRPEVRAERGAVGTLGLPLASPEALGAPLARWTLDRERHWEGGERFFLRRDRAAADPFPGRRFEVSFVEEDGQLFFRLAALVLPSR